MNQCESSLSMVAWPLTAQQAACSQVHRYRFDQDKWQLQDKVLEASMLGNRTLADQTNIFCRVVCYLQEDEGTRCGNMILWRMPPLSSILVHSGRKVVADRSLWE